MQLLLDTFFKYGCYIHDQIVIKQQNDSVKIEHVSD